MIRAVRDSLDTQRGDKVIGADPFWLDKDSKHNPTEFEIAFFTKGVKYIYGFSVDAEAVLKEWLYHYPKGQKSVVFTRDLNPEDGSYIWNKSGGKSLHVSESEVTIIGT
ncbi:MAG: AAA family ATPase [Wolinella sp.]